MAKKQKQAMKPKFKVFTFYNRGSFYSKDEVDKFFGIYLEQQHGNSLYTQGCRCDICREGRRLYAEQNNRKKRELEKLEREARRQQRLQAQQQGQ